MTQDNKKKQPKSNESNAANEALDVNESWIKKIWEWADEFELLDSEVPRNKELLLAITKLEIIEADGVGLNEQDTRDIFRVGYIPDEIINLTNLIEISFSGVSSSRLPKYIGQLTNLTKLDLIKCNLESLPDSIGQLHSLTELNLIRCNFKSFPNSLHQLNKLTKLNFTDCGLRELPDSFLQLTNLDWVNFNGNPLDNLSTPILDHLLTTNTVYGLVR